MGWFSKKLKKVTKILDPAGAAIRKNSGGSYGDPLNWYDSGPKKAKPYQEIPNSTTLAPDPGTGGPTVKLGGGSGGRNYQANPFVQQKAQAMALRAKPQMTAIAAPQSPGADPSMGAQPQPMQNRSQFGPGAQNAMQQAMAQYMTTQGQPPPPQQNMMVQPGQQIPRMAF